MDKMTSTNRFDTIRSIGRGLYLAAALSTLLAVKEHQRLATHDHRPWKEYYSIRSEYYSTKSYLDHTLFSLRDLADDANPSVRWETVRQLASKQHILEDRLAEIERSPKFQEFEKVHKFEDLWLILYGNLASLSLLGGMLMSGAYYLAKIERGNVR